MGKAAKVAAGVIILILILGVGVHFYQMYTVAKSIEFKGASIDSFSIEGFNPPFDPIPDAISLRFRVLVYNPTSYSLELDRLTYTFYIEERYLGEGIKENIYIRPNGETTLYFDFTTRTGDILRILGDMIMRGDTAIDYEIKGIATVPVKLFGAVRIFSVEVSFDQKGYYVIPIKLPGAKPTVRFIDAYWGSTQAYVGTPVNVVVEVQGPVSGSIKVVVMKDIPLMPDKQASVKSFPVNVPSGGYQKFTVQFIPDEASSWKLRGYYLVIELDGKKVWVQSDGYPPRLKVLK